MSTPVLPESYIPLRRSELEEMLCDGAGMPQESQALFRHFCCLLSAVISFEYYRIIDQLKAVYAPFDPDSDTRTPDRPSVAERQQKLNELFCQFAWLMARANYKHLTITEIAPAIEEASDWGVETDVDFGAFERLAIFARGDTTEKRTRRRARKFWLLEEAEVPIWQRLVMILKLRPHHRLDPRIDTSMVFLQIFKNIPKLDINMLLPGARPRFSMLDRGKIGVPLLSGLGLTIWKALSEVADDIAKIFLFQHPAALWGLATGTIGYGVKSYFGYQQTRQRYHHNLTQVLYFQNLDTNSGVLHRLLDEAAEQDCREAILAWHFLWRQAGEQGWAPQQLNGSINLTLEERAQLRIDFDIRDALACLEKLRLVRRIDDRYRAVPLPEALESLHAAWNELYRAPLPLPAAATPGPQG